MLADLSGLPFLLLLTPKTGAKIKISCHKFRLHNSFVESLVTRGLRTLPVGTLDN
jgi:hypothetical protein